MMRRQPPHEPAPRSEEEGAVAVTVAITLTVLILMAAFVIDLGLSRVDSGRGQSVADMAASAGANNLDVLAETWSAEQACATALAYAVSNLGGGTPVAVGGADCATQFASETVCTSSTELDPAVYELGRYRIEIHLPVADDSPLMQNISHSEDYDGVPCERVGVSITSDRDYLLAGVAGFTEGSTTRTAVGREFVGGDATTFASLIILHPTECQVLAAQNVGSRIQVGSREVNGEVYPGAITIYSVPPSGSCTSNNNKVIRASSSSSLIKADGLLLSYGAQQGAANPGQIYQQGDHQDGRLQPRPRPGPPTTRSLIDHEYNCIDPYPTTGPNWRPNRAGLTYSACDDSSPAYIQALHTAYQTKTAAEASDEGWVVWPDDFDGASCNSAERAINEWPDGFDPDVDDGSRWFINCSGTNGSSGVNTFQPEGFTLDYNVDGVEHVIFRGGIRMTGGSSALRIAGKDPDGAIVYMQNHGVTRNNGNLAFEHVFFYVDDGVVDVAGNAGQVTMSPPLLPGGQDACVYGGGTPPPECFERLSMWSNKAGLGNNDINKMGGGATMFIKGILFSPNNAFEITGTGDDEELSCDPGDPIPPGQKLNLRDAQMWSSRITVGGNGVVTLCPSPEFGQETPFVGSGLIR